MSVAGALLDELNPIEAEDESWTEKDWNTHHCIVCGSEAEITSSNLIAKQVSCPDSGCENHGSTEWEAKPSVVGILFTIAIAGLIVGSYGLIVSTIGCVLLLFKDSILNYFLGDSE
jgi:hypothetical protein